ncbi:nitroreductase/quinone reductase family protein [Nonomuraea fuscirosea]|uniref:nitroreductase/quinone reductase family protein n=1 Tax=Nonomuraea fuscirosea TaxID=1291556 RepID=UPI00347BC43E
MSVGQIARAVVQEVAAVKRWMYRHGRPNVVMRYANRLDALVYGSRWLWPRRTAVLKVPGRRTGRRTSIPIVVTEHRGAGYLVSMLGPDANWVRNVRAADGQASLYRRGREIPIVLQEVPPEERAEILRRYAALAPAARPHLGLGPAAPLERFQQIAPGHPVFLIVAR